MILGVIPARGESKGVPRKNLRLINGLPLIAYSIECAKALPEIDYWFVNTDDEEIATTAQSLGAEVPFLRRQELAQDTSSMMDVIFDSLVQIEKLKKTEVTAVVLLDPTAPLRSVADMRRAIQIFCKSQAESRKTKELPYQALISVNRPHRNPYFNMVTRNAEGFVDLVCKSKDGSQIVRRQDAPEVFDLNTVVWIWSRQAVLNRIRIPKQSYLFEVPAERAIDLDTTLDFEIAERLLQLKDETSRTTKNTEQGVNPL